MSSKSLNLKAFKRPTHSRQKYGNEKIEYEGITFDSRLEMSRYIFLRNAEEQGEIENLQCHVTYEIIPKITKEEIVHLKTKDKIVERTLFQATKFTPDFVYTRNGQTIAEDVKGSKFVVSRDFPLRRKLLYYTQGILCNIIYKATTPLP